jgi:hypothetical protein
MGPGTIQKTIALFRAALDGLDVEIPLITLEELAIMVHEAMTVQTRSFHTPEHIFELADGSDPIQALAALFHDVVYYEIDQAFTPKVGAVLASYFVEGATESGESNLKLVASSGSDDLALRLTLDVFGLEADELLVAHQGQNEFLSALLMNVTLQEILQPRVMLEATACIEATIPFRGRNAAGETPAQVLERRIGDINQSYAFGMTPAEIRTAVMRAVIFSNKDVMSFSEQDTGRFLDNTWRLLPEMNPSLRHRGIYTIRSYRRALARMEAFLIHLDPDTIFNRYLEKPPKGDYDRMVALAHRNVQTARHYLGLKLLAVGILEALAEITGGDAPVALFMGAIEDVEDARRIDQYLPDISSVPSVDETSTLFGLLAFGRASSSSFDLQNSPLSLFIFRLLGLEHARVLLIDAKEMFAGVIDAQTFLDRMPNDMMLSIVNACAAMASTRRVSLQAYAASRAQ